MWRWALLMGTVLAGAMDVAPPPAGRAPKAPPLAIGTAREENISTIAVIPAGHRKGGPHRRDTVFVDAGRSQKVLAGKRSLRSIEKRNQKRVFALGQCDRDSAGISEAP